MIAERWLLILLLSDFLVCPVYCMWHLVHVMTYMTCVVLQEMKSVIVCVWLLRELVILSPVVI